MSRFRWRCQPGRDCLRGAEQPIEFWRLTESPRWLRTERSITLPAECSRHGVQQPWQLAHVTDWRKPDSSKEQASTSQVLYKQRQRWWYTDVRLLRGVGMWLSHGFHDAARIRLVTVTLSLQQATYRILAARQHYARYRPHTSTCFQIEMSPVVARGSRP